jgi:hypothetical protein
MVIRSMHSGLFNGEMLAVTDEDVAEFRGCFRRSASK